ncbi:unnamed protein product [Rhizophagus irregularis]|uniref:Chitin-binding type-4 domain-containing protein n=1 Tax=Rhizophagus irregularis TaxID=588596 RepID=A0A2I1GD36_9GLOM|nr:hypothetical protein RhiirA4_400001 [Rhizophagus irregularis]CAB4414146.1 unnamed protein product [Rhizophagus irregularis]
MKFSSAIFTIVATFIASVSSHTTMSFPPTRGHPLNKNAAVQDFECIMAPLNGGSGCAPKKFPCGGYPKDKKIVTTFKAGEVFEVKFFNQNFPKLKDEDKQKDQARHNGGLCEFSLSYDGGKTYTVIASYKKTCPDIFFEGWKVKIPENAPSCDSPGNCIFSWSWINAVGNREFYQNCADVKIEGNATEPLPIIDITRANLPPLFKKILTPEGDDLNSGNAVGSGPRKEDVQANLALKIGNGNNDNKKPPQNDDKQDCDDTQDDDNKSPPQDDDNDNKSPPQEDDNDNNKPPQNDDDGNNDDNNDNENDNNNDDDNDKNDNDNDNDNEDDNNQDIPCSENGTMVCGKEGGAEFLTCDNGKLVSRSCPGILVCTQNGKSIFCGYPKRR